MAELTTKCSVCRSGKTTEVLALIREGSSQRTIAGMFGFSRASLERHVSNCLKLRRNATDETKARAKIKHAELTNDVDQAYSRAEALLQKAQDAGDSDAILKMSRLTIRLLALRQRQQAKLSSDVVTPVGTPKPDFSRVKFALRFDGSDVDPVLRSRFESSEQDIAAANITFVVSFVDRKVNVNNSRARRLLEAEQGFDPVAFQEKFEREWSQLGKPEPEEQR